VALIRANKVDQVAPVITWDPASSRIAPVLVGEPASRVDDDDQPRPESRLRRIATRIGAGVGIVLIFAVIAITIGPRFLPYQTYFVRSGSMEPTVHVGALVVLTKTNAEDLEVGDIITFENPDRPDTLVTHRIFGIESDQGQRVFVTKGDANSAPDTWRVPATGDGWKYAFNIPAIGFVFGYLGTPLARIALLAVPAALLGLLSLMDVWSPKRRGRT
jgi:signal peptidase